MLSAFISDIRQHQQQDRVADIVLAPPYPYLKAAADTILSSDNISVAAQNVAQQELGAYTGEVSAQMVKEVGCKYVIVGHSERRQLFNEDNVLVAEKVARILNAGLQPILCVGESLQERQNDSMSQVISAQISVVINSVGIDKMQECIIAYEPIWAIGTGQTATPEQAQEVHAMIRAQLRGYAQTLADQCRILYGGSVKPDNAVELFAQADIDGGLVGGASLDVEQFKKIVSAVPN